jgi:hypothetical protein
MLIFVLISASVFSIGGLGEDMSVFTTPFTYARREAHIQIMLKPEFSVLNEGTDLRGIFWTNPFSFGFSVPVTKGFVLGVGNRERFNQSFDLYYEQDELNMHLNGDGGIEEAYVNLSKHFKGGEVALRGSYLFGNSSEVWNYTIDEYSLRDSFEYKYHGKMFSAGLRLFFFRIAYECCGDITMESAAKDSSVDLPARLTIGLDHALFNGNAYVLFERSFWADKYGYTSPNRIMIGYAKDRLSYTYMFNPWYLDDVVEHGVGLAWQIPIYRLGTLTLDCSCSLRMKGSVREFMIAPAIHLNIYELFIRRRR